MPSTSIMAGNRLNHMPYRFPIGQVSKQMLGGIVGL
jgi:hypothetical protein